MKTTWRRFLAAIVFTALPGSLQAIIIGPYAPDAATLHLWHLDETTTPCLDSASTGAVNLTTLANGATLGNASFTGLGTALNTSDGGPNGTNNVDKDAYLAPTNLVNGAGDNTAITYMDAASGAFTFEAVIRIDFDPAANYGTLAEGGNGRNTPLQIINGDDETISGNNANRLFQFRLLPIGTADTFNDAVLLEFINLNRASAIQWLNVPVPTSDVDAIVQGGWYHVAVTYDGNAGAMDNMRFYWTTVDAGRTNATLIGTATMTLDLAAGSPDFTIGNNGRNPPLNNFLGVIDEVRISSIARGPGQMLFAGSVIVIESQPSDVFAAPGQPASFTVGASGVPPLGYQWRKDGAVLNGATGSIYSIASVVPADAGGYDVVITGPGSTPVTSSVATLTVRAGVDVLVWDNSYTWNYDWDTWQWNWSNATTKTFPVAYQTGDHARFDDTGMYDAAISVVGTLMPGSVTASLSSATCTLGGNGTLAGPMSLTKMGAAILIVQNDNTYTGPTVIRGGVLQVGNDTATGSIGAGPVTNDALLSIRRTGVLTIPGAMAGTGVFTHDGTGTTILTAESNTWSGGTAITAGTLQIGAGALAGSLGTGTITNDAALVFNSSANMAIDNVIGGSGTLTKAGAGTLALTGANTYRNVTAINAGTLMPIGSDALGTVEGHTTVAGDTAVSRLALGGATSLAEPILLGGRQPAPNASAFAGHIVNDRGSNTLSGAITATTGGNQYNIESAAGVLTMAGDYSQVNGTGDRLLNLQGEGEGVWSGAINNGTANVILTKRGTGTWTLSGACGYTGATTNQEGQLLVTGSLASPSVVVSGGVLGGNGTIEGSVTVLGGGHLAPGTSIGTLTVHGTLNLDAGSVTEVEMNRTAGTFDQVVGMISVTYGGTLTVSNLAGSFAAGDAFKLFGAGTYGGAFAAINPATPGPGLKWDTSALASDGTLRIASDTSTTPTNIALNLSGGQVTISWPLTHIGWQLQKQTNSVLVGYSTNWFNVPGTLTTNIFLEAVDPKVDCTFFRMMLP